jgi:hypothetical protein
MQYFTVRNDPMNSLLDMLPGYALEMRSQDIQRKQERRRVRLAEKTQREESGRAERRLDMGEEQFGWSREYMKQEQLRKQTVNKFLRRNMAVQSDLRSQRKEYDDFTQKNTDLFDQFNETTEGRNFRGWFKSKTGGLVNYDFEKFLTEQVEGHTGRDPVTGQSWTMPGAEKYKKVLKEYKELPDFDVKFPEVELPPGIDVDPSLYDYAIQSWQPTREEYINEVYNIFGGVDHIQSDPRLALQGKPREPKLGLEQQKQDPYGLGLWGRLFK